MYLNQRVCVNDCKEAYGSMHADTCMCIGTYVEQYEKFVTLIEEIILFIREERAKLRSREGGNGNKANKMEKCVKCVFYAFFTVLKFTQPYAHT